ncbi:hypothetical protein EDB81DRAFT_467589 [Dactylonectria macrodidyma]|uniref:Uncharacterized protein n=1 Tax=Dactylonectria macrodidyma TaxID=307937 RepID=A0A9P9J3K2_9HYPO|nr:hypothetical protein EDB81DRAFT_467589 [Dactylonectria macrodidyma]
MSVGALARAVQVHRAAPSMLGSALVSLDGFEWPANDSLPMACPCQWLAHFQNRFIGAGSVIHYGDLGIFSTLLLRAPREIVCDARASGRPWLIFGPRRSFGNLPVQMEPPTYRRALIGWLEFFQRAPNIIASQRSSLCLKRTQRGASHHHRPRHLTIPPAQSLNRGHPLYLGPGTRRQSLLKRLPHLIHFPPAPRSLTYVCCTSLQEARSEQTRACTGAGRTFGSARQFMWIPGCHRTIS